MSLDPDPGLNLDPDFIQLDDYATDSCAISSTAFLLSDHPAQIGEGSTDISNGYNY